METQPSTPQIQRIVQRHQDGRFMSYASEFLAGQEQMALAHRVKTNIGWDFLICSILSYGR